MTTAADQRPAVGEELAAARLYGTYGRQLYRFCLARLRSREEAEDAVQNTFLRVYSALRKGTVPRHEAAWLYKIAHNVCLSRREVLGRRALLEELDAFDDPLRSPVAREERRDELHALGEAVEALPENLRRAILLREWQGLSYVEIAAELGTTVPAVETLIVRARRALAAELEARGTPRRLLDLSALLAGLRSLLARASDAVPAQLAAGAAAAVAVGGAGIGLTIASAEPRPAATTTTVAVVRVTHAVARPTVVRRTVAPVLPVASVAPAAAAAPAATTTEVSAPVEPAGDPPPTVAPTRATPTPTPTSEPTAAPTPTPTPTTDTVATALPALDPPALPAAPELPPPAVTVPDLPVSVPPLPPLP